MHYCAFYQQNAFWAQKSRVPLVWPEASEPEWLFVYGHTYGRAYGHAHGRAYGQAHNQPSGMILPKVTETSKRSKYDQKFNAEVDIFKMFITPTDPSCFFSCSALRLLGMSRMSTQVIQNVLFSLLEIPFWKSVSFFLAARAIWNHLWNDILVRITSGG